MYSVHEYILYILNTNIIYKLYVLRSILFIKYEVHSMQGFKKIRFLKKIKKIIFAHFTLYKYTRIYTGYAL